MTQTVPTGTVRRLRGPITARAWRRTLSVSISAWVLLAVGPWLLGLSAPWRAFAAGLAVPGAGLLYSTPAPHHHGADAFTTTVHVLLLATVIAALGWALRDRRGLACAVVVAAVAAVGWTVTTAPFAIVLAGHIAGFLLVAAATGWAFMFRAIARSDHVTVPALVVGAATVGALLTNSHDAQSFPLSWVSWAAPALALGVTLGVVLREQLRHQAARRVGEEREHYLEQRRAMLHCPIQTAPVPLRRGTPLVVEASIDQLRLHRHLTRLALQPVDSWAGFDREGPGPLQQYRYQLNAVGWGLSMFGYAHTPAYWGAPHQAQLNLLARMQDPRVWGYWYRQNLLGNWDFRHRRADPIDVPQNIMFTGYLNLQLAMFRQATGDAGFDRPGSLRFQRSPERSYVYDHPAINDIVLRNFRTDLCLWACEPVPVGRKRKHGLVFPYCNAVAAAGVAVLDAMNGTAHAAEIAARLRERLESEFTAADGDVIAFLVSGLGLAARGFRGPASTAAIAAFVSPLLPDLAWRSWQILRDEWLDSGRYRHPTSGGKESPTAGDWGSGAPTNAEPLAAALLLAQECGEGEWWDTLWTEATRQLQFTPDDAQPGVWAFERASVHANGMLGLGGLGRAHALTDMMTVPRPQRWTRGPRIRAVPYPAVLVAKAVTDGAGLDAVLRAGQQPGRCTVRLDQLVPQRDYRVLGAHEAMVRADDHGRVELTVDVGERTVLTLRPT
ncbi:hypothetical protein DFR70_1011087 [Nocardia tenerifensis]|uniref:Linalool dehydratase/isomerase domain-containing protein n=1 Tax=Nocardia tenerifensis TaxID=228006 RepID=A0A318KHK8_9NOCA|nr:hypothetical protein [Nocardia tenerifensis]PXX71653.1 hypothetical protein DFR70_1011087 [Nocardia tenerifensis]